MNEVVFVVGKITSNTTSFAPDRTVVLLGAFNTNLLKTPKGFNEMIFCGKPRPPGRSYEYEFPEDEGASQKLLQGGNKRQNN